MLALIQPIFLHIPPNGVEIAPFIERPPRGHKLFGVRVSSQSLNDQMGGRSARNCAAAAA